jgi:hypothetical protein
MRTKLVLKSSAALMIAIAGLLLIANQQAQGVQTPPTIGTVGVMAFMVQDVKKAVVEESKKLSAGRQLLTRISDFTKTLTEKLNDMTFHEKQQLVRTVLQEVVINGNTVRLFFKIPLPKKKVTDQSGDDSPNRKTVSSQFGLRSPADQ